ncbi:MAG: hypothetical protein RMH84_04670 [Sulfolobales archaeon]|nr:hypothetical protein [Sulfolobales archaeon]MCX8208627.1 hypothetical protein [Sulfolobales archaeon]MDW8010868.1 hypothetical protein [Sulfolobales archaeon]
MSICPWYRYRDGFCTSPSLETPTPDVVNKVVCLGGREVYTRCRYYREVRVIRGEGYEEFGKPFLMVHGLDKPPEIPCEFAKIFKLEQGRYVAGCAILKRFLGVHEVELCESYWERCPYRKLGLKLVAEI